MRLLFQLRQDQPQINGWSKQQFRPVFLESVRDQPDIGAFTFRYVAFISEKGVKPSSSRHKAIGQLAMHLIDKTWRFIYFLWFFRSALWRDYNPLTCWFQRACRQCQIGR